MHRLAITVRRPSLITAQLENGGNPGSMIPQPAQWPWITPVTSVCQLSWFLPVFDLLWANIQAECGVGGGEGGGGEAGGEGGVGASLREGC